MTAKKPINDGGPAFPVETRRNDLDQLGHQSGVSTWQFPGMTLRDAFAMRAMQGQIEYEGMEGCDSRHIAGMAYELADAMIAQREKDTGI